MANIRRSAETSKEAKGGQVANGPRGVRVHVPAVCSGSSVFGFGSGPPLYIFSIVFTHAALDLRFRWAIC